MRPNTILMVYPEFPVTYWSLEHVIPYLDIKASMPPLGLLQVAAMLPEDWPVTLVDLNVRQGGLRDEDFAGIDLVFLSAMSVQEESFNEVVALCRAAGKTVVAGGPYVSSVPNQIHGVDHLILGEAETLLPRFLADLDQGKAQPVYETTDKPDLSLTLAPRMDLIDPADYLTMPLQFSRGCPFNCEFCEIIKMFGRQVRTKSPEQFLAELDAVYASGFRGNIFLVDDNFIGNRNQAKRLLMALIDWQTEHRYPYSFLTEASLNLASEAALMGLMVGAGFDSVFIGIESPDEDSLRETGKLQNLRGDILSSVKRIQSMGLNVMGGFILGFDHDPDNIRELQTSLIREAGIPQALVSLLNAPPGTRLFYRMKEEGRLLREEAFAGDHLNAGINFVPRTELAVLRDRYEGVLADIYEPGTYFRTALRALDHLPRRRPKAVFQILPEGMPLRRRLRRLRGMLAFAWRILRSPYAFRYMKFFVQAWLINRKNMAMALVYAVQGYHNMVTTRQMLGEAALTGGLDRSGRNWRETVAVAKS